MNYDEAIKIMQGTENVDENNIIEKLIECFENGKVMALKNDEYELVILSLQRANKEHAELSAIKQVVENWDEGEYYTDSIHSMKKIEDIIKGESK